MTTATIAMIATTGDTGLGAKTTAVLTALAEPPKGARGRETAAGGDIGARGALRIENTGEAAAHEIGGTETEIETTGATIATTAVTAGIGTRSATANRRAATAMNDQIEMAVRTTRTVVGENARGGGRATTGTGGGTGRRRRMRRCAP